MNGIPAKIETVEPKNPTPGLPVLNSVGLPNETTAHTPFGKEKENPIIPSSEPTDLSTLFILEYRADGAIHSRTFSHCGTTHSAIERAKLHCQLMRYRFIFCSPFLYDMERQEKRMEAFG